MQRPTAEELESNQEREFTTEWPALPPSTDNGNVIGAKQPDTTLRLSTNHQLLQLSTTDATGNSVLELKAINREVIGIWDPDSAEYKNLKKTFQKQLQRGIERLMEAELLLPTIKGPITISNDLFVVIPGLPPDQQWQRMSQEEKKAAARVIHPSFQPAHIAYSEVVAFMDLITQKPLIYLEPYQNLNDRLYNLLHYTTWSETVEASLLLSDTSLVPLSLDKIQASLARLADKNKENANPWASGTVPWTNPMPVYQSAFVELFGSKRSDEWLDDTGDWVGEMDGVYIWWSHVTHYLYELDIHYGGTSTMTPGNVAKLHELLAESSKLLAESMAALQMPPKALAYIKKWEKEMESGRRDTSG